MKKRHKRFRFSKTDFPAFPDDRELDEAAVRQPGENESRPVQTAAPPAENAPREAAPFQPGNTGPKPAPPSFSLAKVSLTAALSGVLLAGLALLGAPELREWKFALLPPGSPRETRNPAKFKQELALLTNNLAELRRKNTRLTPFNPYLIVDTADNKFFLFSKRKLIREGMCSTGSYTMLKTEDNREWIFKTPRGMFRIQGKIPSPVWRMPDWAFIEEGRPVPPPDSPERYEPGVLGDYALALGGGYLIHGTLYQRYLGMPVTHGCVRLGDEDLESIYRNLEIGSRVYIY